MDNNVNNNTDNNVNIENTVPNVNTAQTSAIPTGNGIIQPDVPAVNIVAVDSSNIPTNATTQTISVQPQPAVISENPVVNTATTVTPTVTNQPSVNSNNNNKQEVYYKKIFVMMGIIVGGVLLISGILLYFLLNGTIENRNRLTCTKTIQGDGYEEHIKRYYTFDGGIMKRVYVTHTFTYNELTDDIYNQTFDEIINNDTHFVTEYGLGTNISKEDNVVTINAYDINYSGEDVKSIEKKNKNENFTCK